MKTKLPLALFAIFQISFLVFAQRPTQTSQPPAPPAAPRLATAPKQTSDDDDVVRITTKLVQMDAVVTDKNGKQVTDLRPDEVQIFEDGKRQAVTHFSYVVAGSTRPTSTAKPAALVAKNAGPLPPVTLQREQVRRTIALVVDDLGLSFESIHSVRDTLKRFVDEQMQSGDLVAIIRTGGSIGALQQFTADKRILYAAIDRVRWHPMSRAGITAMPRIETGPNLGLPPAQEAEVQAFLANAANLRGDAINVGTIGALSYVVRGLGDLPGRKSVVLISDGIKVFYQGDRDTTYRVLEALQRLSDMANRASVVFYTIDPRGLQPMGLTAGDSLRLMAGSPGNPMPPIQTQVALQLDARNAEFRENQNGMNMLATQTGGLFIHNDNDLTNGIHSVMEDQQGYYLVGYRPDESTFDAKSGLRKFHSLTLKVTRPGRFTVRMRKGFFGVTDAEAKAGASTPQLQVIRALTSPFGASGVHVRLTSAFSNDAQRGSMLSSMLHVSGSDLTFTDEPDGWHKADFDVVAITYGDNGRIIDQVGQTHSIRVRGDSYQNVLKEGFVYIVEVPVNKPGAYQLRVALRDHGSEQVGSASQFVQVPDLTNDQLTLSSVLVNGIDPATLQKPAAGAAANTQNQLGTEEVSDPRNAAAVRQFHNGTILQYGFAMYNARLDKVTGRPQLKIRLRILRDGVTVFSGQDEAFDLGSQSDLKRLTASGGIQLGSQMTPGEYVFQVIVTDLLAEPKHRVATQWVDFEIIK